MPLKGKDYEIFAYTPCPDCGSKVRAHGLVWRCTNKKCHFIKARKFKKQPRDW